MKMKFSLLWSLYFDAQKETGNKCVCMCVCLVGDCAWAGGGVVIMEGMPAGLTWRQEARWREGGTTCKSWVKEQPRRPGKGKDWLHQGPARKAAERKHGVWGACNTQGALTAGLVTTHCLIKAGGRAVLESAGGAATLPEVREVGVGKDLTFVSVFEFWEMLCQEERIEKRSKGIEQRHESSQLWRACTLPFDVISRFLYKIFFSLFASR